MLLKIGFLNITVVDVFDILLITFLFYKIYQFVRGSVAARMVVGLLLISAATANAQTPRDRRVRWNASNMGVPNGDRLLQVCSSTLRRRLDTC